jgi:hypothetical protein
MKLTQKQVNELFFEEEIEVEGVTLTTVEEGDFEQDSKYQSAELIFTDGTVFTVHISHVPDHLLVNGITKITVTRI